ncbi:hypothetical protein IWZ00DRAFT_237207 [Phyllosticta capitalensis]|uniref:uncharacterized protein n=1 Tax=Phyllosticta capitalensis TaxID=121624 RepID=UPI00312EA699
MYLWQLAPSMTIVQPCQARFDARTHDVTGQHDGRPTQRSDTRFIFSNLKPNNNRKTPKTPISTSKGHLSSAHQPQRFPIRPSPSQCRVVSRHHDAAAQGDEAARNRITLVILVTCLQQLWLLSSFDNYYFHALPPCLRLHVLPGNGESAS